MLRFSSSEKFSFLSRCLQDAEVLLKLTEQMNATVRNNVCIFFLFGFEPNDIAYGFLCSILSLFPSRLL